MRFRTITKRGVCPSAVLLLLCALIQASCATLTPAPSGRHLSAQELNALGGMKIGTPHLQSDGAILVPVALGRDAYFGLSTPMNYRERSRIKDDTVQFWVETWKRGKRETAIRLTSVRINKLPQGKYNFVYLNPDGTTEFIGTLRGKGIDVTPLR